MSVLFYMDVHVHSAVTEQLRRRSVDVLTAQDDDATHLPDDQLLERSTTLNRVLFTYDIRFKALAEEWQRQSKVFAGLIWAHPMRLTIGRMVTDLEIIAKATESPEWLNVVDQLPL
ncbi:MAG: DUF5615 family PIN-like protein [Gemmataceae bacterium]